jgi:hypothetical protein
VLEGLLVMLAVGVLVAGALTVQLVPAVWLLQASSA